jgi:hypothetical protein
MAHSSAAAAAALPAASSGVNVVKLWHVVKESISFSADWLMADDRARVLELLRGSGTPTGYALRKLYTGAYRSYAEFGEDMEQLFAAVEAVLLQAACGKDSAFRKQISLAKLRISREDFRELFQCNCGQRTRAHEDASQNGEMLNEPATDDMSDSRPFATVRGNPLAAVVDLLVVVATQVHGVPKHLLSAPMSGLQMLCVKPASAYSIMQSIIEMVQCQVSSQLAPAFTQLQQLLDRLWADMVADGLLPPADKLSAAAAASAFRTYLTESSGPHTVVPSTDQMMVNFLLKRDRWVNSVTLLQCLVRNNGVEWHLFFHILFFAGLLEEVDPTGKYRRFFVRHEGRREQWAFVLNEWARQHALIDALVTPRSIIPAPMMLLPQLVRFRLKLNGRVFYTHVKTRFFKWLDRLWRCVEEPRRAGFTGTVTSVVLEQEDERTVPSIMHSYLPLVQLPPSDGIFHILPSEGVVSFICEHLAPVSVLIRDIHQERATLCFSISNLRRVHHEEAMKLAPPLKEHSRN